MKEIIFNLDANKRLSLFNSDIKILQGDRNAFKIRLEAAEEWKKLTPWIRLMYFDTVTQENKSFTAPMVRYTFDLHNGFTQGKNVLVSFALYDGENVEAYTEPVALKVLASERYDDSLTPQQVTSILAEVSAAMRGIEDIHRELDNYIEVTRIGAPNGVVPLNEEGLVPIEMLPNLDEMISAAIGVVFGGAY